MPLPLTFNSPTGIGVSIPITRGNNGFFAQTFAVQDEIKSNLINLLMTKKGERVFQPNFGCDIHSILFEQMTPTMNDDIKNSISNAVSFWMPFLNITDTTVKQDEDQQITYVSVTFSLKGNSSITDTIIISF